MNMNTIRQTIGTLRAALGLFEIKCNLVAGAVLRMDLPSTPEPLFPDIARAAQLAGRDPQAAVEIVKATLLKWEEL